MAARKALTASEWLDLIEERAMRLRRSGVYTIGIGEYTASLAPLDARFDNGTLADNEQPSESSNPLFDSATYADGKVPGYVLVEEYADAPDDDGSS